MDKNFVRLFSSVFGFVGLVFLAVAIFSVRSELAFRSGALEAPGTIVDLLPTTGSEGGTMYKPVFEFADRNDRTHRVTGSVASSPPAFRRGEAVRVIYHPGDAETARLDSFMEAWFLPMIFGTLGTIFTSVAGGFVFYAWRRRRPDSARTRH